MSRRRSVFATAQGVFEYFYNYILEFGRQKNGTRYLRNMAFTITNPEDKMIETPWRKWKHDYAELEWQWYLSGDPRPRLVEGVAKLWASIKDDRGYVNSNYGYWWNRNGQYLRMIKLLQNDPSTRRAVLIHYSVDEVQHYDKDTPCNLVLNFYIEDSKINIAIFARSVDLVYGFCNDQYCFSKLLERVSNDIKTPVGILHYAITDLHIYEKHWAMKSNYFNN